MVLCSFVEPEPSSQIALVSSGPVGQPECAGRCRSLSGDVKRRSGAEGAQPPERSGAVSRHQTGGGTFQHTEVQPTGPELTNAIWEMGGARQTSREQKSPGRWVFPTYLSKRVLESVCQSEHSN